MIKRNERNLKEKKKQYADCDEQLSRSLTLSLYFHIWNGSGQFEWKLLNSTTDLNYNSTQLIIMSQI